MQRVIYPINAVFTVKYLLTILLFISGVASADITGIAHVIDGDTVKINNSVSGYMVLMHRKETRSVRSTGRSGGVDKPRPNYSGP